MKRSKPVLPSWQTRRLRWCERACVGKERLSVSYCTVADCQAKLVDKASRQVFRHIPFLDYSKGQAKGSTVLLSMVPYVIQCFIALGKHKVVHTDLCSGTAVTMLGCFSG